MAQTSPVRVTGISQVGLVVKDLERVAMNYWNILGIGPWDIYSWQAPLVCDRKYHGKPAEAREKVAITQVGDVQLKLVQPLDGVSIYQDFLMENGEGLHHLQFLVDDLDKIVEILAKKGFLSLQSGRIGDGAYHYIDIRPLHAIWELFYVSEHIDAKPTRYPDTLQESPAKVKVREISQVALDVENVQKTAENYWNILGIGPWDVVTAVPPALSHLTYHGKPGSYTFKIALAMVGSLQIELMQPVSGESVHADVLREHGPGLHHFQFIVDDIKETTHIMESSGLPALATGEYAGGGFAFYDTVEPLKCVWEALQVPKEMSIDYRWPE